MSAAGLPWRAWFTSILAIFLGGLGIHRFYLGKTGSGFVYLVLQLLCIAGMVLSPFFVFIDPTLILSTLAGTPALLLSLLLCLIGFIEGIVLLCKDQEAFDDEYNDGVSPYTQYYQQQQYAAPQQPQQQEAPQTQQQTPAGNAGQGKSKTEQLLELKQLLDGGILTQEEFDTEKQKILNS